MKRFVAVLGLLALAVSTAAAQSGSDLYQQALRRERTDGDLRGAITLYERVTRAGDRALAARALVRIGEVYERMGRQEALQAYQRVVRDFADQAQQATAARARIAALESRTAVKAAGGLSLTAIEVGTDPLGAPSPDGRYRTVVDWKTGNLALLDLESGATRQLSREGDMSKGAYALGSVVSRDSKRIAFFFTPPNTRSPWWLPQLRIVNADGTGERTLIANADTAIYWLQPFEFSADGSAVLTALHYENGEGKLALVSTATGRITEVVETEGPRGASISAHGNWIAYDEVSDTIMGTRDIVLISADGSRRTRLSHPASDQDPIFTPDGKHLLFTSDRTGAFGLWAVRVGPAGPEGEAFEVRGHMPAGFRPMGFSGDRLFYQFDSGGGDIFTVGFDTAVGSVKGQPERLVTTFEGRNTMAAWTPDGSKLLYASARGATANTDWGKLVVRDVRTGVEQEYAQPPLHIVLSRPQLSPNGRYVVTKIMGGVGHSLVLVDLTTRRLTTIAEDKHPEAVSNAIWSRDGSAFYYSIFTPRGSGRGRIMAYDVSSQSSRELLGGLQQMGMDRTLVLAPSGDSIFYAARVEGQVKLRVVSIRGGPEREIATIQPTNIEAFRRSGLAVSPDGKWILYGSNDTAGSTLGTSTVYAVPVAGGEVRKIGLEQVELRQLSFAPDGRLTFAAGPSSKPEIWALDGLSTILR